MSDKKLQIKDQGVTFTKLDRTNASLATSALYGVMNAVYPVGSIYISILSTDPDELLFGNNNLSTWARFGEGKTLVSQDSSDTDFDTAETDTGGAKTVQLTAAESGLPAHSHTFGASSAGADSSGPDVDNLDGQNGNQYTTGTTGGSSASSAHQNMPPYIVVYMWKRTA